MPVSRAEISLKKMFIEVTGGLEYYMDWEEFQQLKGDFPLVSDALYRKIFFAAAPVGLLDFCTFCHIINLMDGLEFDYVGSDYEEELIFRAADADNRGSISRARCDDLLQMIGINVGSGDVRDIVRFYARSQWGVTYPEFANAIAALKADHLVA